MKGWDVLSGNTVTVQEGKCIRQAVETHNRSFSRWEEARFRWGGSVKYQTCPNYCNKPENRNCS